MIRFLFSDSLLKGKAFLVFGATSGIGHCVAKSLELCGSRLILVGRSLDKLKSLYSSDRDLILLEFNFNDSFDCFWENVIKERSLNPLNGVFFNAGWEVIRPLPVSKPLIYQRHSAVILDNFIDIARRCTNSSFMADHGSIVSMSSVSSTFGVPGLGIYSSLRASLESLTRTCAVELSSRNIRANSIAAGAVETSLHQRTLDNMSDSGKQKFLEAHPLGYGKPVDIAYLTTYLLSDASRWITGTTIVADGGYSSLRGTV